MLRRIMVSPFKESRLFVSIIFKHRGPAFEHIVLVAGFVAIIASVSSVCAQPGSQDSSNPQNNSHAQICDQPKNGDKRDLSLATTGSQSSDLETSSADEQSASQSVTESGGTDLNLPKPSQSVSATEKQELLCKRSTHRPASVQPVQPTTGDQPPTVQQRTAVGPVVTYTNGQLTIDPKNARLGEVMEAIQARTGLYVEYPAQEMSERVFDHVGPVSVREALMQLLYGSGFNYIFQTSSSDPQVVNKLFLSARTSSRSAGGAQRAIEALDEQGEHQSVYGGFTNEAPPEEIQEAKPPSPPAKSAIDASTVPGIPAGFNLQQAAAESHKTTAQILDEMQKRQLELLDAQAPPP